MVEPVEPGVLGLIRLLCLDGKSLDAKNKFEPPPCTKVWTFDTKSLNIQKINFLYSDQSKI